MAKPLSITPAHKAIKAYYAALNDFEHQKVAQEQAVRSAFQHLLTDLSKRLKWTAIPEHGKKVRGKRIIPDGTLKDKYHLPRGYWEAEDTADDLEAEIRGKAAKGYPLGNTIFWTPTRAVLYQEGAIKYAFAIDEANGNPGQFCDLLTAFFTHEDKIIVDFDEAVETFTTRVPEVGTKLAALIADAHTTNATFKKAFSAFFALCQTTLNPNISREAVDEMLVQHLLTVRLFKSIFNNPEFLRKNVIAVEVEKVIDALSSRSFNRDEFLKSLDHFYVAIENAASRVQDWSSKQEFLNTIYERFFQGYCVKTADTHGIVYTPQPIVDFMCASVEWVLREEFGKKLGDDGVHILDPCTGTGNFVVNLMRRAADRGEKYLKRMYAEQLFANEIMLMPYYIAALNIEHEYFDHVAQYEAFEGLCFVDTLELAEPKHTGLFTAANLKRVVRQKSTPIEMVIGNPPYNVGQMIHNEQNQNRPYPVVDQWVRSTYAKDSTATSVSKLNDPYVKFFRWATRRLEDRDGIVCFVSNNAFVENIAYDGMRKHLAQDFQAIYHLDLEGNVRQNPTLSGTRYNVFGIQVGVGITVCVKRTNAKKRGIFYANVRKDLPRYDKLALIERQSSIGGLKWTKLKPDDRNTWLTPENAELFAGLVPVASRVSRASKSAGKGVIFKEYSLGIATHRDSVVYDFSKDALTTRTKEFIEAYNTEVDRWKRAPKNTDVHEWVKYEDISWDRDLKNDLKRGRYIGFHTKKIVESNFRPFCRRHLFYDRIANGEVYGLENIFPPDDPQCRTKLIAFSAIGNEKDFYAACLDTIPALSWVGFGGGCQCAPAYIVDENDKSCRIDNITDWALDLFHRQYIGPPAAKNISKENLFHYVYAMLHHTGYRETFAENLKRELPRIPLAASFADFKAFVKAGEQLGELHLKYDDEKAVKPYRLKEVWSLTPNTSGGKRKCYRVDDKMRLATNKGSLRVNESLTLEGIPEAVYRYRLGNRSALEWVIDQYQVYTDPKTGQVSDANAWGEERDDAEYIVRLVKQVVTVSLETMKIVEHLPKDFGGPPKMVAASRPDSRTSPADAAVARPAFDGKGWELKGDHTKSRQSRLRG